MKQKPPLLKIVCVEYLKRYILKILFNDGKEQTIDFEPFLKRSEHPEIRKFLDIKKFTKYEINKGELIWGDFDLIFPIIDLYNNKISPVELATTKTRSPYG